MDRAGILASLCFPSFPRFCGQIFWEAKDKELALLCVRAYNDWMIDEWCGTIARAAHPADHHPPVGPGGGGRGDRALRRQGATGIAFSENPEPLGLPTIHDPARYWDPVMAACRGHRDHRVHACRLIVDDAVRSPRTPRCWPT